MSTERGERLAALQARLGYRFADPALLERALTHRSWAHDRQMRDAHGVLADNERLEFLGDCAFYAVAGELLYALHPGEDEGRLSRRRRRVVDGACQVRLARAWGLDEPGVIRVGRLSTRERERGSEKFLEDATEALVGAAYLDGGWPAVHVLLDAWVRAVDAEDPRADDPKTALQERLARLGLALPRYDLVAEGGPAHDRWFEVAVAFSPAAGAPVERRGQGRGRSKKEAEKLAAIEALASGFQEG